VIGSTRRVAVHAFGAPTDMRKSFDTLSALVTQYMNVELLSGDVFLFVGRDRKRAKALFWDGTGLCVYAKRLEKGRFAAPWKRGEGKTVHFTMSELALLLEGSELIGKQSLSPAPYVAAPLFPVANTAG
jgi:transposase